MIIANTLKLLVTSLKGSSNCNLHVTNLKGLCGTSVISLKAIVSLHEQTLFLN